MTGWERTWSDVDWYKANNTKARLTVLDPVHCNGSTTEAKASSHIGGIQRYCNPSHSHIETLWSNFEYRQIPSIQLYSQYREIPSATVNNHLGTHQIPLGILGNPEYSKYPACTAVWQELFKSPATTVGIPRYLKVFGLPTSLNTEYAQIPSNIIWELA